MNKNDPKGAIGATKCPLHLIPPASMEATAWALKYGADKYGIRNWREARIKSSTYEGAIMRHLNAWRGGEDMDPDSGILHLGLISANVAILLDAICHGVIEDDRNLTETKEQ